MISRGGSPELHLLRELQHVCSSSTEPRMATGDRLTGNKRPASLPLEQSLDGSPIAPGAPLQQASAVHSPIPIVADPRVSLASIVESDRTSSETALRAQVQSLLEFNARLSLQLQQQMQAQAHERSMFGKQLQEMQEALARSKQQLPPATISTTVAVGMKVASMALSGRVEDDVHQSTGRDLQGQGSREQLGERLMMLRVPGQAAPDKQLELAVRQKDSC